MSEIVNIENSSYEFEIIIFSQSKDGKVNAAPISKSSIKHLILEDNLIDYGYTGTITFTNFYGLLQKIGVYNSIEESPFIFIRFKNLDFSKAKVECPEVYVLASLGRSSDTGKNIIDKNSTFEFEEYITSKLKRTTIGAESLTNIGSDFLQSNAMTVKERDFAGFTGSTSTLLYNIFSIGASLADIKNLNINIQPESIGLGSLAQLTSVANDTSAYDLTQALYLYLAYDPLTPYDGNFDLKSPSLIRLEEINKERGVVAKSLASDIKSFFNAIKDPNSPEISKYLTEKFIISTSDDIQTFRDNNISDYSLIRPNYDDVLNNKWTNLQLCGGSLDCSTSTTVISYEELRYAFEQIFTAPYACNLPERKNDIEKGNIKTTLVRGPGLDDSLIAAYGVNKVFKSFIFDNLAITFRVKGQPYRNPGKFIQITLDNVNLQPSKEQTDEINGYWYIVSLKHVFENDIYFNDYICVKFYSNSGTLGTKPKGRAKPTLVTGRSNLNKLGSAPGGIAGFYATGLGKESIVTQGGQDVDSLLGTGESYSFGNTLLGDGPATATTTNTPAPTTNKTPSQLAQFYNETPTTLPPDFTSQNTQQQFLNNPFGGNQNQGSVTFQTNPEVIGRDPVTNAPVYSSGKPLDVTYAVFDRAGKRLDITQDTPIKLGPPRDSSGNLIKFGNDK